jgi:hypothetical protein
MAIYLFEIVGHCTLKGLTIPLDVVGLEKENILKCSEYGHRLCGSICRDGLTSSWGKDRAHLRGISKPSDSCQKRLNT